MAKCKSYCFRRFSGGFLPSSIGERFKSFLHYALKPLNFVLHRGVCSLVHLECIVSMPCSPIQFHIDASIPLCASPTNAVLFTPLKCLSKYEKIPVIA